ncbi:MAG: Gfo/Idh/MocA family oxidoreductase [Planctomycetota bacterium]
MTTADTSTQLARVGIVGCGNILGQYVTTFSKLEGVSIVALSDLDRARAEAARDEKCPDARVLGADEVYADDEVDVVLNLTVPRAHEPVARAAIEAGKHVYNEKPLTEGVESAKALLELAERKGVTVGCAPDTVLGSTWQLARRVIDRGDLGEIVGATVCMQSRGMESWHPSPSFFYQRGGGPVYDMGPYFFHALITLLGPMTRVRASGRMSFPERVAPDGSPTAGARYPVEVLTHTSSHLFFESGAFATALMSFDVHPSTIPSVEIYGSEATMVIHTPNNFAQDNDARLGKVEVRKRVVGSWQPVVDVVEETAGPAVNGRGIGLADQMQAVRDNRPARASGELALHALEVMEAIDRSAREHADVELSTRPDRPAPVEDGWTA